MSSLTCCVPLTTCVLVDSLCRCVLVDFCWQRLLLKINISVIIKRTEKKKENTPVARDMSHLEPAAAAAAIAVLTCWVAWGLVADTAVYSPACASLAV